MAYKMTGKSPLMKKLLGKQHKLPGHLKQAIMDSPAKMYGKKSPAKMDDRLKKKEGFGPRAAKGSDDQSKELAKSRYEMGEYKTDPTAPPTPKRKVMKDGAKSQTVMQGGKKVDFVPYSQRKKKAPAKKKKPSQGDFIPAYPGADISKAEYDKRRKAGSTKRD